MSIVRLKRMTLVGLVQEKTSLLEQLQSIGCMHLIPFGDPEGPHESESPFNHAEDTRRAMRHLLSSPLQRRRIEAIPDAFDADHILRKALKNLQRQERLSDRREFLRHRIDTVAPWGDFEHPPPSRMGGLKLWYYVVPNYRVRHLPQEGMPWQVVYRDNRHAYVVAMNEKKPAPEAMPVPRSHLGRRSLTTLYRELDEVEAELETLTTKRAWLTRWVNLLLLHLARSYDRSERLQASHYTLDRDGIFAVQGWIPVTRKKEVARFAEAHGLAYMIESPGEAESPPTLLDNPEALRGGEDLVGFFQLPGYRLWDPSLIVFFSFALFFAMILSDAGYALVLGGVLLLAQPRLNRSEKGRRLRRLGAVTVAMTMAYGMLVGSYFGVAPPTGSPLDALNLLDLNDFQGMMQLSVGVGVAHLVLANLITAWQRRPRFAALPPLGWALGLIGGLVVGFSSGVPLATIGGVMIGAGALLVLLFSGGHKVTNLPTLLKRMFDGFLALTNVTKAFGDVLSYLRLFALGLASASLATTFNQIALEVFTAYEGVGLFLAILIIVVGHALNLILCVVSGVVHGLRLNLIEFYNWSLSEEGYPFKAFKKREMENWTT